MTPAAAAESVDATTPADSTLTVDSPALDSTAQATQNDSEVVAEFSAIGTQGFVAINADQPDSPIQFPTPDEVDNPIAVDGEIYADGTWEATDVQFPNLDSDEFDIPVDIELEPAAQFNGTIDRETGRMTVNGSLAVIIPAAESEIVVDAQLTTAESGNMSGATTGLDTTSAEVTVVDNQFIIPEPTGDPFIDGFIGLPSTEPGTNWFSLTLGMEIDEDPGDDQPAQTGTVEGIILDDDGEAIEGATVEVDGAETTTGTGGTYQLGAEVGSQEITVSADGFQTVTETVEVTENETVTQDFTLETEEVGTAYFDASLDTENVDPGETVVVDANLINTGDAPGEQTVTISVGGVTENYTVSLDVNEQQTVTLEWNTTEEDEGQHEALVETANVSLTPVVIVGNVSFDLEDADFLVESTGGFITFGYDTFEEAEGTGLELPDINAGDDPIQIAGVINEEAGTWEAIKSFFPPLRDPSYPFDGFVEILEPLHGDIDLDEGYMTAETRFKVYVDGREDATFTFDIVMTTGQSGELNGTSDIGEDEGEFTLVANNYSVNDQTGSGIIDSEMNLPSTDPNENYLKLGFTMDRNPENVSLKEDENITSGRAEAGSVVVTIGQGIGTLALILVLLIVGTGVYTRVNGEGED